MNVKETPGDQVIQPLCSDQGLLEQLAEEHVQSDSEHLQGWKLHNLSGKPVPVFDHPHSKKTHPHIFICLSGISCVSVCAHYLLPFTEKGLAPQSLLPSTRYVYTFPRFPSAKQSQHSQPPSHVRCCNLLNSFSGCPLDLLQYVPELDTVLQVSSPWC